MGLVTVCVRVCVCVCEGTMPIMLLCVCLRQNTVLITDHSTLCVCLYGYVLVCVCVYVYMLVCVFVCVHVCMSGHCADHEEETLQLS